MTFCKRDCANKSSCKVDTNLWLYVMCFFVKISLSYNKSLKS